MKKRILLVDDDREVVRLMKAYLEQAGYETLVAYDGETALHTLRRDKPDLILLDLGLPDVDGQTLLGMLRRNYGMEDIPIIVCTAWPPEAAKKMAEAYGFDGYISKPYKVNEFMEIVNKFI